MNLGIYNVISSFDLKKHTLPPIVEKCPRCDGKLIHFINHQHRYYTINCAQQATDSKLCGFSIRKRITIKGKANKGKS